MHDENVIKTRLDLFKHILRYRCLDIVILSLTTALFYLFDFLYNFFVSDFINNNTLFEITLKEVIHIIPLTIFFIGLGGTFYFCKKISFQEGTSVRKDFFEGVFKNFKMFFKIGLIVGLLNALLHIGIATLLNTMKGNIVYVLIGIMYLAFFFFMMMIFYVCSQTILYQGGFIMLFKNAIKFTFGNILKNVLFFGILFIPFILLEFFANSIILLIVIVILSFIYFGIMTLIFTLMSYNIFDKTINKNYKELINKGLSKDD